MTIKYTFIKCLKIVIKLINIHDPFSNIKYSCCDWDSGCNSDIRLWQKR